MVRANKEVMNTIDKALMRSSRLLGWLGRLRMIRTHIEYATDPATRRARRRGLGSLGMLGFLCGKVFYSSRNSGF